MHILGEREPLAPSGLAMVDEDAEILFEPLVLSLGLTISLGVIGRAYILFDI